MKKTFFLLLLFSSFSFADVDDYEPGNESRFNRMRQANEWNLYDRTRERRVQIRRTLAKIRRISLRCRAQRLIEMRNEIQKSSCTCIHDLIKTPPTNGEVQPQAQQTPQPMAPKPAMQHIPELQEAEDELRETGESQAIVPKPSTQEIPELQEAEEEMRQENYQRPQPQPMAPQPSRQYMPEQDFYQSPQPQPMAPQPSRQYMPEQDFYQSPQPQPMAPKPAMQRIPELGDSEQRQADRNYKDIFDNPY